MSLLNSLMQSSSKQKKRLGRGYGSGKGGHTSSRGMKGQRARTGSKIPLWFEGGQLPLVKRLPMMRGKSRFNVLKPTAEVSIANLNKMKSDVITLDTLKLEKVIDSRFKKAKIIGGGEMLRKVTVQGVLASKTAAAAIAKAGGSVA